VKEELRRELRAMLVKHSYSPLDAIQGPCRVFELVEDTARLRAHSGRMADGGLAGLMGAYGSEEEEEEQEQMEGERLPASQPACRGPMPTMSDSACLCCSRGWGPGDHPGEERWR
jgi:hypothetical protein